MSIPKQTFFRYIKEFKLKELFNDLGWDNTKLSYPVKVDEQVHTLTGIAEKKGFVIFLCTTHGAQAIPDSSARKKIDNAIARLHHEHLIIYIDGKKSRQRWELLVREQNKPLVARPIDYYVGQEPELLFQKLEGLFFEFNEEEKLSIVDVRSKVMANFEKNAEVVTKKFYERFSKEHEKFLSFINGIQGKVDQEWYASLMLNRLMFIYFIQKKGFLDNDRDYLRIRLKLVQQKKGKNKFYSFYRNFLLVLFHKGLGSPLRDAELEAEIGKVPYLNGGLFDVHKLEEENRDIKIEDKAFERIFDFFDEYNWHLDTRVTATGKDINPDVIGYIFEKYINDRAAMGAYYTKEDITEYISKNCIVPWLFDEVKRNYAKPFVGRFSESTKSDSESRSTVWTFLQQSGDTYIYPAVKHGIRPNITEQNGFDDLPDDVRSCIDPNTPDLVEKRKCWNRPAPPEIALPTEIYREVIARRKRYYEVRKKIEQGEITEINDFITYNLNIRQFAQDVLEQTDDPKLVMEFYKAVRKITVLDPTCGSGAFLFAALNVLEPLYFACVTRMREFIELDGKGRHKFFEEQLALIDADDHPNEEYFIYKSIILHNLYGVDIMKEAVEIAKLRLFLKLVATVDVDYKKPNLGLEPLPDIDFNIRSGNTLVGYATLADLDKGEQGGLFGDDEKQAILEEADVVSRAYARFKDAQFVMHSDPRSYKDAKDELNKRLSVLNDKLNRYLAVTYLGPSHSKAAYEKWLASHQPFHWLAEYYTTIAQGGFNVIIGNPPYVEYSKKSKATGQSVKDQYGLLGYRTLSTGNLYAFAIERSRRIQETIGRFGMIIPVSSISSDSFRPLADLAFVNQYHVSSFSNRPGKIFKGVEQRLLILLSDPSKEVGYSSPYMHWYEAQRPVLISSLTYVKAKVVGGRQMPYKTGNIVHNTIIEKLLTHKGSLGDYEGVGKYHTYYHDGPTYWIRALPFEPSLNRSSGRSNHYHRISSPSVHDASSICTILNSSLFYLYFKSVSNCRDFGDYELHNFPVSRLSDVQLEKLASLCNHLRIALESTAEICTREYPSGPVRYKEYYPAQAKPIIDEIDKVLAKHYGFTPEELDFIINYDIKYRMGKELSSDDGD
jgi:hypothetical protein